MNMKPLNAFWKRIKYTSPTNDIIADLRKYETDAKRGLFINSSFFKQFIGEPLLLPVKHEMLNIIYDRIEMLKSVEAEELLYDNYYDDKPWYNDKYNVEILESQVGMSSDQIDDYIDRCEELPLSKGSCQWYKTKQGDFIIVCWSRDDLDYDFLNFSDLFKYRVNMLPKNSLGNFYEISIPASRIKN